MLDMLKNFYATLTSTESAAATAAFLAGLIPVLLKLAALLKLDAKKLPKWAQPIPGFAMALAVALLEQLQSGSTIWDSLLVLAFGFFGGAGLYHTAKRWTPGASSKAAAALVLLVAVPCMSGCGIVRSASDEVASVCEGYLAAQPQVQAQAAKERVSPLDIARAICLANDAGRAIWELFQVQEPGPGVMLPMSPEEQLERARDQALDVAVRRGILQP
jgi:hypothetical protein